MSNIFGWSLPAGCNTIPDEEDREPSGEQHVLTVDWDEAYSVSTEEDSIYFDVEEQEDGWYMSADIDCNSGSFTDSLIVNDGPYATKATALQAGLKGALKWMSNNHHDDYEIDSRLVPDPKED